MESAFKTLIIVMLVLILLSLSSGMFFLTRDDGKRKRTVTALTVRIVLSLSLAGLLLIGYYAGWIHPHGLLPAPVHNQ